MWHKVIRSKKDAWPIEMSSKKAVHNTKVQTEKQKNTEKEEQAELYFQQMLQEGWPYDLTMNQF